jgi:2-polyprenyl-3-methyl-5-hydroxy-6-metoxy-1,4-benzoquinol methylase
MRRLKSGLLAAVSGATGRPAVLLSADAAHEAEIIRLRTRYRIDSDAVEIAFDEPAGTLVAALHVDGDRQPVWMSGALACGANAVLSLSLINGVVRFENAELGTVTGGTPVAARRLSWSLELTLPHGGRKRRRTGHYVARVPSHEVGENYFEGEDYVDYEAQSASVHEQVLALAAAHRMTGPVLEVGAATGGTLKRLRDEGLEGVGVDFSPWAVAQAERRLGPGAVHLADVERETLPSEVVSRGPFGALVMASVFEHFAHPFDVLARLSGHMRPGAHLVVLTTNADSLTHRLFGPDWEGYFDWTHKGVDRVSAAEMKRRLPTLGWTIVSLRTWHVWDGDADPTKATLREWCDADARFRRLLEERDLGDFLECVAVRA